MGSANRVELGILATFQGSDESLKPLILFVDRQIGSPADIRMSHYDVVPAPNSTADRWTHPAFSGFNDGKYIWGRGAADDKTLLVAQCMSLNELL
jgi:Gly-Xaa carboxypeptidase